MKTLPKLKAPKSHARKITKQAVKRPEPKREPPLAAVDALLDEALDETFPASDPVALTQPSQRRRAALRHAHRHAGGG